MKIFVIGVPHVPTLDPTNPKDRNVFPFSEENWWLCYMFQKLGYEVIHLGVPGSNPPCAEHVDVVPKNWWQDQFGNKKVLELLYIKPDYCPEYSKLFIENVRAEIVKRAGPDFSSIVCANWGGEEEIACKDLQQFVVEPGIGYLHTWAPYKIYRSYAWMHYHLGTRNLVAGGTWYDWVIPMPVNIDQYGPIVEEKRNYLLYLGRIVEDKGVRIACQVARETNVPLVLAGRGDPSPFMKEWGSGITFINNPSVEKKRELLRYAKGLFVPTCYVEPFGLTILEAGASGCPVITTDWGAFCETVLQGVTGFRCRNFGQFVSAVRNIDGINPKIYYEWVRNNYNLDRIAVKYDQYFKSLLSIKDGKGWYTL
jgi:glycosyltransferase involved in cell wall biosynthesis